MGLLWTGFPEGQGKPGYGIMVGKRVWMLTGSKYWVIQANSGLFRVSCFGDVKVARICGATSRSFVVKVDVGGKAGD